MTEKMIDDSSFEVLQQATPQCSGDDLFQSQVLGILHNLKEDFQHMSDRVAKLEDHRVQSAFQDETQSVNEPSRPQEDGEPAMQSTPWADVDPNEKPDFSFIPSWDEEEEDDQKTTGVRLFKTSEKTEAFLKQSLTTTAPNQQRRQWREKIGAPNTPFTACPSMDKLLKSRLSASAKTWDRTLAKHQALMLDAVGPITHILEEAAKGQLTPKTAVEAAQTALKLLGNASMQVNRKRRRCAIESLNPSLMDLADEDDLYKNSAPQLFGEGFFKKEKERDKELQCLNQATGRQTNFRGPQRPTKFF